MKHGDYNKFRDLIIYEISCKPEGYWTENTIISELESIINDIGHFPTGIELRKMNKGGLGRAINRHGGYIKFRELMGYELIRKRGYWTDEIIISEIESVIEEIGHFPTQEDLSNLNRHDLKSAIREHGGFVKFRTLLRYELLEKPKGYWTDETIIT